MMKLLIALLATAGLGGCVAYPYDAAPGYYGAAPGYYGAAPGSYGAAASYEGSVSYGSSVPYVVQQQGYGRRWGGRDRDGDGVRNRADRDRDGDGVPNWRDAHPNNPRRY